MFGERPRSPARPLAQPSLRRLAKSLLAVVIASSAAAAPQRAPVDDAQVRRAWSFATDAEREDVLARVDAESAELPNLQNRLVRAALALEERDHNLLPAAGEPAFYDPRVHAPGQPIPRRWVEADSADARRERERRLAASARRLRSAWRYDWAARDVVRCADPLDVELRFENALSGFRPKLDLAEALVERALDGGEATKALAAFAHAYTDRDGRAFPGITLYDVWASGSEMEMPDVDVLGLVHELLPKEKRWVAPVPTSQHSVLYRTVGEQFTPAHRYRAIRTALARCYLLGSAELPWGYSPHVDRFHALWNAHESNPSEVAAILPNAATLSEFLGNWTLACEEDPAVRDAGRARRAALDADCAAVRTLLVQALADLGAFERTARPEPPPKK